jgi:hypothetical protein
VEKEGSENQNTRFVILHLRTPRIPNSPANPHLYMFWGEKKFGAWPLCNEKLDGYGVDENEIIVHFVGRREDRVYSVDEEQLDRFFKGSFTANVQMPVDEGRFDDWQLYVVGRA